LQGRRQMVRVTGEERPGKLPCPPLLPTIGQCAASAAATVTARDRCGRRAAAAGLLRTGAVAPSAAGPALASPREMTLADAARRAPGRAARSRYGRAARPTCSSTRRRTNTASRFTRHRGTRAGRETAAGPMTRSRRPEGGWTPPSTPDRSIRPTILARPRTPGHGRPGLTMIRSGTRTRAAGRRALQPAAVRAAGPARNARSPGPPASILAAGHSGLTGPARNAELTD